MNEPPTFICTMCSSCVFNSFDELSVHLEALHNPKSLKDDLNSFRLPVEPKNSFNTISSKLQDSIICNRVPPKFSNVKKVALAQKDFFLYPKLSNSELLNGNVSSNLLSDSGNHIIDPVDSACLKDILAQNNVNTLKESDNSEVNDLHNHATRKHRKTFGYSCFECGKMFSSAHNLERHKLVHESSKNFVCEFCGLSFRREDSLKDHHCILNEGGDTAHIRRTKNQEEVVCSQAALVCPTCGKSFANVSNLNKHTKTHEEKREVCRECGRQFHVKASLRDHIIQVHKGGVIMTCPVCNKELKGRNSLFTHLVRFHPEQKNRVSPPKHVCPDCGRIFHQRGNLQKHRLTHSDALSYVCPSCKAAFRFPEQLRRHRLKHESKVRHSCEMCDRAFVMEYELKNHVQVYHGGMSYVCKYCSLSCKHLQAFRRHLQRRHGDEMEWQDGGLVFLKNSRVVNNHYINIKNHLREDANQQCFESRIESQTAQPIFQVLAAKQDELQEKQSQLCINQSIDPTDSIAYLTSETLRSFEGLISLVVSSGPTNVTCSSGNIQLSSSLGSTSQLQDFAENMELFRQERGKRCTVYPDGQSDPSFASQMSDSMAFDLRLIPQNSSGSEEQDGLMSIEGDGENGLTTLSEFISFPPQDSNASSSPSYLACMDECV